MHTHTSTPPIEARVLPVVSSGSIHKLPASLQVSAGLSPCHGPQACVAPADRLPDVASVIRLARLALLLLGLFTRFLRFLRLLLLLVLPADTTPKVP